MTKLFSKSFAYGSAIAIILPSAALADVSALDVWQKWKSYNESFGQTVTVGSQETSSDALILRDVTMSVDFPDGSASGTIALLEFRERGDGTVALTMSPDLPISASIRPKDGKPVDVAVTVRQSGLSVIASGETDNINFDYLASQVSLDVDKFEAGGVPLENNVHFELNDIDGKYNLTSGDASTYSSQLKAGSLNYTVAFVNPDKPGRFTMQGSLADVATQTSVTLPGDINLADPTAFFSKGVALTAAFASGASNSNVQLQDDPSAFSWTSSAASNALNAGIQEGSISYGGSATGVNYALQSPKIPFPEVTLGFAEIAFNLLMPMTKSDTPQDYGLTVRLAGLEISDMIWGVLDRTGTLPHDPATIALDLGGTLNWLVDITNPEKVKAFDRQAPANIQKLDINDIEVSAVGANITGKGAFTFNNDDLQTFGGVPAPTGQVDLRLVGLNGLLDNLIQMGLLPDDKANGMRMMLGLFARPAGGDDTLTSTIEVKGDGSVFANGQQLK
jgi:Uncharacterized protein conserved in bacteria (DUF2125)